MIVDPSNVVKVSTYNGLGNIDTFSTEVIANDTPSTPEPATMALSGGCLVYLGMLRRKKSSCC